MPLCLDAIGGEEGRGELGKVYGIVCGIMERVGKGRGIGGKWEREWGR